MEERFFLIQIKRSSGVYEKGIVVKNTLDEAKQSYHAYLGAYGYGHDPATDYVQVAINDIKGATRVGPEIDDRRPAPEEEE